MPVAAADGDGPRMSDDIHLCNGDAAGELSEHEHDGNAGTCDDRLAEGYLRVGCHSGNNLDRHPETLDSTRLHQGAPDGPVTHDRTSRP